MANESKPDVATDAELMPPPAINTKATSSRSNSTKNSPILARYVPVAVARSRDHDEDFMIPLSPSFDTPQGDSVLPERLPELNNTGELSPKSENDGESEENEPGIGDDDSGTHGHERWMANMERKMVQLTSTALRVQRERATQELQSSLTKHGDEMKRHISEQIATIANELEPQWPSKHEHITKAINDSRDATKVAMDSYGKLISDHQSSVTGVLERNMESIKTAMESRGKMMSNFQSTIIDKLEENTATTETAMDSLEEMTFEILQGLDCQHADVLKKIGSLPTKEDNKRIIDEHFRSVMEAIDKHKSDISASVEDMEDVSAVIEERDAQLRRIAYLETKNARLTYERNRALASLDEERRKAQGYFRIRKRSLKWASTGLVALTALRNSPSVLRAACRWSVPRLRQVAERMAASVEDREQKLRNST